MAESISREQILAELAANAQEKQRLSAQTDERQAQADAMQARLDAFAASLSAPAAQPVEPTDPWAVPPMTGATLEDETDAADTALSQDLTGRMGPFGDTHQMPFGAGIDPAAQAPAPLYEPSPVAAATPTRDLSLDAAAREKTRANELRAQITAAANHIKALWQEAEQIGDFLNKNVPEWLNQPEYRLVYDDIYNILDAERGLDRQISNIDTIDSSNLQFVKEQVEYVAKYCDESIARLRPATATLKAAPADTGHTPSGAGAGPDEAAKPVAARDIILADARAEAQKKREEITGVPSPEGAPLPAERKDTQKNLEKLRATYLKAKSNYERFQGVKGFLDRQIIGRLKVKNKDGEKITRLAEAEEKLLETKKEYEDALREYKREHLSEYITAQLDEVDSVVKNERDARKKNYFLRAQNHWKKLGLARGLASASLFGVGAYFGIMEVNVVRRGLGGTGAGFGLYDLWSMGAQALREHVGKLRELTPEKIAKMKSQKEVAKYLAAFEIDAARKMPVNTEKDKTPGLAEARGGIELKDDIRYIKLMERFAELRAPQIERALDDKINEADTEPEDLVDEGLEDEDLENMEALSPEDEIREKARKGEKRNRALLAGAGILASAAVGFALGTGAIQAALGLGQEAYMRAQEIIDKTGAAKEHMVGVSKEAIRKEGIIEYLRSVSKAARETTAAAVAKAATDAQSELAGAGAKPDEIIDGVNKATAAARKAAEETFKKSMEAAKGAALQNADYQGETGEALAKTARIAAQDNVAKATAAATEAAAAAEQKEIQGMVEAAKKAVEAEKAAREAALAAAGKTGDSAAQAADTTFKALPKADQMKEIFRLTTEAQTKPEISDAALKDIAQERLANKEFKTLKAAITATQQEYLTRVATTRAEELSALAKQIGKDGKLTLEQFEQLRNLASWHDTHVGDAAHKLLAYVENPDNKVFETSEIEEIKITKDKSLFEAFSEAEHKLGVADAKIDANFAHFLEQYGIDAINAKGAINADVLAAAKHNIKHVGETLWYSSSGDVIASQELEMMDDEITPEQPEQSEQPPVQDKPDKPVAKEVSPKTKAKIPTAKEPFGPPADLAAQQATTAGAKVDARVNPVTPDATPGIETGADIGSLPKGWEWVSNAESIRNIAEHTAQIQANPEIFYKHVVQPLIGFYPRLGIELFNQEMITSLVRDAQHGKENILQLYNAFIAEEKSPIKLQIAGQDATTIEPRKK